MPHKSALGGGGKESNYDIISTNELVDGIFYSFFLL